MDPVLRTRFAIYADAEQQKKIAKIIDEIVNADAYINELKPQGLPEPQEPESDLLLKASLSLPMKKPLLQAPQATKRRTCVDCAGRPPSVSR